MCGRVLVREPRKMQRLQNRHEDRVGKAELMFVSWGRGSGGCDRVCASKSICTMRKYLGQSVYQNKTYLNQSVYQNKISWHILGQSIRLVSYWAEEMPTRYPLD